MSAAKSGERTKALVDGTSTTTTKKIKSASAKEQCLSVFIIASYRVGDHVLLGSIHSSPWKEAEKPPRLNKQKEDEALTKHLSKASFEGMFDINYRRLEKHYRKCHRI